MLGKIFAIFAVLLVLGAGVQARAASFDCARASTAMERTVCSNRNLSALDEQLAKVYSTALTRALDPSEFRQDQRDWLRQVQKEAAGVEQLTTAYTHRIEILNKGLASPESALRSSVVAEGVARKGCLAAIAGDPGDLTCSVAAFVHLGAVGPHDFFAATYAYRAPGTTEDTLKLAMRVVLFERAAPGQLRVLFAPFNDGANFEETKLLQTHAGTLLHIAGYDSGTGNFNRERLFVWREDGWHDVDTTSWLATLQRQLPNGLGAWKGIYPDYATMRATTPLWRTNDSNCCPTSGKQAVISLGWSGDRIVLDHIQLERAKADQ